MTENFLNSIDMLIQSKHLLNHPFYLAWTKGELSKECLKEYAIEYYHHVKAFPRYLSAVHARTEDAETSLHLLHNLMEEQAGSPNHPDMWRAFAISLGATNEEIDNHTPSHAIDQVVKTFLEICNNGSIEAGVAALYAYESQIPSVCVSKIKGLKQHYGMTNSKDWNYFTVHIEADKEHAAVERQILSKHVKEESKSEVILAVDRILDALNGFLSHLCDRYQICQVAM